MTKELPAVALLLDECRGTHIPRDFVQGFDVSAWGLKEDSWAVKVCLEGHYAEDYWDAWQEILDDAKYVNEDGSTHTLYQDGSVWALKAFRVACLGDALETE